MDYKIKTKKGEVLKLYSSTDLDELIFHYDISKTNINIVCWSYDIRNNNLPCSKHRPWKHLCQQPTQRRKMACFLLCTGEKLNIHVLQVFGLQSTFYHFGGTFFFLFFFFLLMLCDDDALHKHAQPEKSYPCLIWHHRLLLWIHHSSLEFWR